MFQHLWMSIRKKIDRQVRNQQCVNTVQKHKTVFYQLKPLFKNIVSFGFKNTNLFFQFLDKFNKFRKWKVTSYDLHVSVA